MIWFYSDPHFGHENVVLKFGRSEFKDAKEMNELLIKNYNEVVRPEDVVYFMGDVYFGGEEKLWTILKRMNGTKILIRGNHDDKPTIMVRAGFVCALEKASIRVGKREINLSHYPYRYGFWKQLWWSISNGRYTPRNLHKRMVDDGKYLIHGHTHSKRKHTKNTNMIHVGVDAWQYRPVSLDQVTQLIDQLEQEKKK
jgi:calcineurin-like phosphoesterase family protein